MKRLIILLLILSCFRVSYAQELTSEQQQLAWKFIYNNMFYENKQPDDSAIKVFNEDIVVNLKGEVTSEDSTVVNDIIKNIQIAMPYRKISLSIKSGNLKILINEKGTGLSRQFKDGHISNVDVHVRIPDSVTSIQRRQLIYYVFLKRAMCSFQTAKIVIPGMNGCVFAEDEFKSITFSPFDLFILEKLYSPDFSIQLARNLDSSLQEAAWKSIQWLFMGKPNDPLIFSNYIFIKLLGNVSPKDSVCFHKSTTELDKILPEKNRFFFTDGDANLTFTINTPGVKLRKKEMNNGKNITIREFEINIPKDASDEQRLKIIYFHLYRSLVHFSPTSTGSQKVPGCVFDEEYPEAITFHPFDKFMLSKLYATDFQEQFKSFFVKNSSSSNYYKFRFNERLKFIGIAGGLILAIMLVSILILMNVFRKHNWKFRIFLSQVIWGIIAYDVFFLFSSLIREVGLSMINTTINFLLINNLVILLTAILFFFVEKKIHFSKITQKTKTILLLIDTIAISYLISFLFVLFIAKENGFNLIFLPVFFMLIITTARFFMISLSGINTAELKKRDNELILLKEKSKQAELQSLRAKINPHFLYNALNSIASLATTDARKTEQMALALSDFFKYAINREQKQLNTLSEELNAIRTYLEIEKVRFGDRLSFEIDCPAELLNIQIPQLIIQPLVENAIKHGLSQITENGLISILVCKEENLLKIRVYDNGPAFPDGPLSGFGIQNTQERIALLYGAKATINWQNGAEKYIEISIPIGN